METLAVPSRVSEPTTNNLRAENSTRKGHRIAPLTGTIVKENKKKRRNTAKGNKKRLHVSTPLNSDDSEKPQADQWTNSKKSGKPNPDKGSTKEGGARKSHKSKSKPPTVEEAPALATEDQEQLSSHAKESVRWEGVLEDPGAEAERLEIYRANRRKRYMASRQMLLESIQAGLGPDPHSKIGSTHKVGPAAKVL
ncbi:protein LIAT1 [Electrophorus electricus]|uniref:protein LIAT1 n=1 Tax=Electrophorus electricus TaxID=8005 RepID=UPI0015D03018|nr:protein LIAT1 [Electrophorus electricus]